MEIKFKYIIKNKKQTQNKKRPNEQSSRVSPNQNKEIKALSIQDGVKKTNRTKKNLMSPPKQALVQLCSQPDLGSEVVEIKNKKENIEKNIIPREISSKQNEILKINSESEKQVENNKKNGDTVDFSLSVSTAEFKQKVLL